jgi:hypothetical protein
VCIFSLVSRILLALITQIINFNIQKPNSYLRAAITSVKNIPIFVVVFAAFNLGFGGERINQNVESDHPD